MDDTTNSYPFLDASISVSKAYVRMLIFTVPLLSALTAIHLTIWGLPNLLTGLLKFATVRSALPALLIGIPLHELIHGLSWLALADISRHDIKLGFQWRSFTPYAHLRVPIKARDYRWGALMPTLWLGLAPYLYGLATGSGWFVTLGLLFILAGGGDLLILAMLQGVDRNALVSDHPTRAGCIVLPPSHQEVKHQ